MPRLCKAVGHFASTTYLRTAVGVALYLLFSWVKKRRVCFLLALLGEVISSGDSEGFGHPRFTKLENFIS